tara:strand:- start:7051 stop:7998 length:948 start_codon:yes stop_codon:yes gene_type:complete
MNIGVVTVTYSDRRKYLFKMLESLIYHNITVVTVVCNGVSKEVFDSIEKYSAQLPYQTTLVYSPNNLGSAGGFKKGINQSPEHLDFLLLLDDDNTLSNSASLNDILKSEDYSDYNIYYIKRPSREAITYSYSSRRMDFMIGEPNSVLGKSFIPSNPEYTNKGLKSDLLVAPYGGLILNKKVLNEKILPNEKLFLYADDYEYTYRLVTREGYSIKFIDELIVVDIEDSHHLRSKNKFWHTRFSSSNEMQIYYAVRNQLYFDKLRVNNLYKFYLNYIFVGGYFISSFALSLDAKRLKIFMKAYREGVNERFICNMKE